MPRRPGPWLVIAAAVVAAAAIGLLLALRGPGPSPLAGRRPAAGEARPDAPPAQPPPASAADQAAELVGAARAQAAAGDLAGARARLAQAYALDPRPATLLALGAIEHQLGHCREARRAAQGVIAAAPGEPLVSQAQELLARIGRCD